MFSPEGLLEQQITSISFRSTGNKHSFVMEVKFDARLKEEKKKKSIFFLVAVGLQK